MAETAPSGADMAYIYYPPRNLMQSGRTQRRGAPRRGWCLRFLSAAARGGAQARRDPLMGWSGRGDTLSQVALYFETQDDAIAYAKARGLAYAVQPRAPRNSRRKDYTMNFSSRRRTAWTH